MDSTTVKNNSNIYPTKNPVIEFDLLKAHRLGIDTNLLKTKINKWGIDLNSEYYLKKNPELTKNLEWTYQKT